MSRFSSEIVYSKRISASLSLLDLFLTLHLDHEAVFGGKGVPPPLDRPAENIVSKISTFDAL